MKISIAGNTTFAYYCAEKLCREGIKVDEVFIPEKGGNYLFDFVDFKNLSGEFDVKLIKLPQNKTKEFKTDLLINLEWPLKLELPVKAKLGSIGSNMRGQFDRDYLLDIAADIYNGKNKMELQLLWEKDELEPGAAAIDYEPPFFKVISSHSIEINHLDDLRSAKTKAITGYFKLLTKSLKYININQEIPRPTNSELSISRVKVDKLIDWNKGAIYLHNLVRSLTHPGPGAYTLFGETSTKIWRGHYFELSESDHDNIQPGTILDIIEEVGLIVKTGHGSFLVTRVQSSGSPELPAWVWADREHVNYGDKFVMEYIEHKTEPARGH